MHYLRCIHSIAPSGLVLFFCPRGRHTLANLSPQPHWLRKQTGVFAKHLFHLWLYICNAKHLNEQLNQKKPLIVCGPFSHVVQNIQMFLLMEILWRSVDMANNPLGARGNGARLKHICMCVCRFYLNRLGLDWKNVSSVFCLK